MRILGLKSAKKSGDWRKPWLADLTKQNRRARRRRRATADRKRLDRSGEH